MAEYEELEECLSSVVISDLEVYREEPYCLFDKQVARSKDVALIVDECCAGLTEMFLRLRSYENGYTDLAEIKWAFGGACILGVVFILRVFFPGEQLKRYVTS